MSIDNDSWLQFRDGGSDPARLESGGPRRRGRPGLDAAGAVLGEREFKHGGAGLTEMATWLLSFTGGKADEVGVAVETSSGSVVESLLECDPSAGVTFAAALVSALAGQPVRGDVTMTGELTPTGMVEPVAGTREKVLAACRAGMAAVILPAANEADVADTGCRATSAFTTPR